MVLVLGTKLEVIVAKMAIELKNQTHVIKGAPMVQPNDNLFWFSQPKFVLTLLHFTLFTVIYPSSYLNQKMIINLLTLGKIAKMN